MPLTALEPSVPLETLIPLAPLIPLEQEIPLVPLTSLKLLIPLEPQISRNRFNYTSKKVTYAKTTILYEGLVGNKIL